MRDPDDVRMCDCAGCGRELLGESERARMPRPDLEASRTVAGRIAGRPYCDGCLTERQPPSRPATFDPDGPGPWQENAIRAMEEGTPDAH